MSHELVAYLGVMDAGKSTLALQYHHSLGGTGVVYTSMDRGGEGVVSSRIGLSHEAREVKPGFDIYDDLAALRPPYVIVDEVQFLEAPKQINHLADAVDGLEPRRLRLRPQDRLPRPPLPGHPAPHRTRRPRRRTPGPRQLLVRRTRHPQRPTARRRHGLLRRPRRSRRHGLLHRPVPPPPPRRTRLTPRTAPVSLLAATPRSEPAQVRRPYC